MFVYKHKQLHPTVKMEMEKQQSSEEQNLAGPSAETLTKLITNGETALNRGEEELAQNFALRAMIWSNEAMGCFLRGSASPYTEQQLADWFGKSALIFNGTGDYLNAARCFYTATVFDPNWTREEHASVAPVLWRNIMLVNTPYFLQNYQIFLAFIQELNKSAQLAEERKRWQVCDVICSEIFRTMETFTNIRTLFGFPKGDSVTRKHVARDILVRAARCGLVSGHTDLVRITCQRVLKEFTEDNDAEALEIWGKSLMTVNNYHIAQKKISDAVKIAESKGHKADIERLHQILEDIDGHIRNDFENREPDSEWLVGTGADSKGKILVVRESNIEGRIKKRHKRPKAREKSAAIVKKTNISDAHIPGPSFDRFDNQQTVAAANGNKHKKQRNKTRNRHANECSYSTSISSFQVHLSDLEFSESDDDNQSLKSDVSSACSSICMTEDEEESDEDEYSTYFEASCRFHADGDKNIKGPSNDIKVLREGLHLNEQYCQEVKKSQKKKKNESYYEPLLSKPECIHKLQRKPHKYKKCSIQVEGCHVAYCTPIDNDSTISVIEISGRSKAGQTFNEDVVVVEILDDEHEDKDKRYGKVVGILERKRYSCVKHPVFICTLDDMESHLVRPLCKTIPKMNILHSEILKTCLKQKKNKIELYRYNHMEGSLELDSIKDIKFADRGNYVFLVAYLQWERQQYSIYPVGAVIKILPCGKTIKSGLKILDLQYEVPLFYSATTVDQLQSLTNRLHDDEPTDPFMKGRTDLTHLDTFTIDPAGSKDLDDALSIEKVEDGYKVGVHIADVSMFIEKGDDIDSEAYERAVSFYPGVRRPRHMLPEPLSQNICSLVPGKRRLCISVFHYLNGNGRQLLNRNVEFRLTVIKSKRQLTYVQAQNIITDATCPTGHDPIVDAVKILYGIAKQIRFHRLGNSMFALDPDEDDDYDDMQTKTLEAHYLVEEFMVLTNCKVSKFLSQKCQQLVPLRCQPPPTKESLQQVFKSENFILNLLLKLQDRPVGEAFKPAFEHILQSEENKDVMVQKWVWNLICESPENALRLVLMDELHPLQYLAYEHWLSIQEHALYRVSDNPSDKRDIEKHFSLDVTSYTHFTSPIRRYIDIVTHRLMHCALKEEQMPYTGREMQDICHHVNSAMRRSKAYEKGCRALQFSVELKSKPLMIPCYIDEVSDKGMTLCAPELKFVSKSNRELAFSHLNMGFKPEEFTDGDQLTIKARWNKRLYDFSGIPSLPANICHDSIQLNPYPGMIFLPAVDWAKIIQRVVNALKSKDLQSSRNGLKLSIQKSRWTPKSKGVLDVNTESNDPSKIQPSTSFTLSFTRGQMINIQMTAEAQKGLLAPKPQLFNVTKSFKCCLLHTDDPVKYLSSYSTKTTLDRYASAQEYLKRWLPLIAMETAVGAVSNTETININNLPVKFRGRFGKFSLSLSDCELRNIEISGIVDEEDEINSSMPQSNDYLCIRSTNESVARTGKSKTTPPPVWVAHAAITEVRRKCEREISTKCYQKNNTTFFEKVSKRTRDGTVIVNFELHQLSQNPPMELADTNGILTCGVEMLIKVDVDRRTEIFLNMLQDAESPLAECIALNNNRIPELDKEHRYAAKKLTKRDLVIPESVVVDGAKNERKNKPLPPNNKEQQIAIDKALGSRFTLIQGPPGTGKTYTGIKLLYLFDQINKKLHEKGHEKYQVLFCGPSNKSVDLVARWMLERLGNLRPDIVRVYGRSIEEAEFPIPGSPFFSKGTKNAKADEEIKSVVLHHLIRQKGKPYAEEINAYDRKFKRTKYVVDTAEVKEYVKVVREASIKELKGHDVILCTTAVGSNPRIREGTTVFQIIIDESGMCPEPHCLVPIIDNKAQQVVLIGDHKQLRPIIKCKEAAELGLEKSLFEKYWESENARSVEKIMLERQYRMNPQLCYFPSKTFYEGKLRTEPGQWKEGSVVKVWSDSQGRNYPHVLIDVRGEEKNLTVSTEEGNEQSKSNDAEVDHVVKVYKYLINQTFVGSVNIISQYNAQRHEIRKRLEKELIPNFRVNTVVSSQGGEWDYVIFSTVRSLPEYKIEKRPTQGWCKTNLGFITDKNQINVALTRAKKGLIVIGNKELLQCDETWGKFVRHYEKCGCIKSPEEFPPKTVRHEQTRAAILRSQRKYGDERFEKVDLGPLGPYIPAPGEEDSDDGEEDYDSDGEDELGPLGPYIPAPGEEDSDDGEEDYDSDGKEELSVISDLGPLGPYIPAPGQEEDNGDGEEDYDNDDEEEPSMISRFRSLRLQQRTNNSQRQSQIDSEGLQFLEWAGSFE